MFLIKVFDVYVIYIHTEYIVVIFSNENKDGLGTTFSAHFYFEKTSDTKFWRLESLVTEDKSTFIAEQIVMV